jgi:flagellar protein FliO/FliZ
VNGNRLNGLASLKGNRLSVAGRSIPTPLLLGAGALLALGLSWLFGALAGSPSAESSPLDAPATAVDVTLKLLAVLALIYAALAGLRRYTQGVGLGTRRSQLKVLESSGLGHNRSVVLVQAGRKHLVLGVTATQITMLATLEADELVPEASVFEEALAAAGEGQSG